MPAHAFVYCLYLRGTDYVNKFSEMRLVGVKQLFRLASMLAVPLAVVSAISPALAHHPMGGRTPSNVFEGFMSGVAHPLIGPDHFAFVVAVGLLAATRKQGVMIPFAFVLAAMFGAGMHLANLNVPGIELFVSGSVALFGILLALKNSLNTGAVAGLSALAGLFHGYAYGEAIFGAQMTPLVSYLAGFTIIQLGVSLTAFWIGTQVVLKHNKVFQPSTPFHSAGLVICGMGLAFFISQMIGILFPIASV
jgi:urease accessory protein